MENTSVSSNEEEQNTTGSQNVAIGWNVLEQNANGMNDRQIGVWRVLEQETHYAKINLDEVKTLEDMKLLFSLFHDISAYYPMSFVEKRNAERLFFEPVESSKR